ncbi:MAG: DUF4007 family protein, partial [Gemmatimonadota bacterium]|nr:DUF4007 family protein [Gemmatimonadota bacterium]
MNFAGHETFPFRYNWLTKGYARIASHAQALGQLDATMKELGLGKNMARSLRHWMLATRMCDMVDPPRGRQLRPTALATLLLDEHTGWDRFLEDPGSLWLIHWSLCSEPGRSTTWHVAFSLIREAEFTRRDLTAAVERFARANGSSVARGTIQRDVDCFLHCYVPSSLRSTVVPDDALACPLAELGLITRLASGRDESFAFARGPQLSLHDLVFAYLVADFWQSAHAGAMSLSFDQLAYGPGSPGMVLRLDENSLAARLDALEALTDGAF